MHIPASLLPLFDEGLVHEVVRPLMSGKEASVYLVRFDGHDMVAKVYKEAQNRTFRQRAAYAEGRQVRNSRERRAIAKGSGYGKARLEDRWQNAEVEALHRLHEAGVRVPVPFHHAENVLLMELVCDEAGEPAPRLYDLKFTPAEARALHARLVREVTRMLCAGLVHGDLSEYNVLMSPEGPVIIDLPQTTDAATNNNAERLFLRDVDNLSRFLGRWAPELRKTRYGPEIWNLYARAELTPDSELTGRFTPAPTGHVDTRDALTEIREAEAEGPSRPLSAYALKKQRRAEAAKAEAERAEAARTAEGGPAARPRDDQPRKGGRGGTKGRPRPEAGGDRPDKGGRGGAKGRPRPEAGDERSGKGRSRGEPRGRPKPEADDGRPGKGARGRGEARGRSRRGDGDEPPGKGGRSRGEAQGRPRPEAGEYPAKAGRSRGLAQGRPRPEAGDDRPARRGDGGPGGAQATRAGRTSRPGEGRRGAAKARSGQGARGLEAAESGRGRRDPAGRAHGQVEPGSHGSQARDGRPGEERASRGRRRGRGRAEPR